MPSQSENLKRTISYVVLGMLETQGPLTAYLLRQYLDSSVAMFWPFPSSQVYAETKRLENAGLVAYEQETSGRRRRTYQITEVGRQALYEWLATSPEPTQIRDPALLRLFFTDTNPDLVAPLARKRIAALRARLDYLEQPGLGGTQPYQLRVLDYGRINARASLAFWESVLADATASPHQ